MTRWPGSGPDDVVAIGDVVVRRAQPSDAAAYSRVDARMVGDTYASLMPLQFAADRWDEVDRLTGERRREFAEALEAERRGEEPPRRTWVATQAGDIAGIAVSTAIAPSWEASLAVEPIEGITYQLNHLYLRPAAQGTGLGQAMLDLALPCALPAYLWIVGGNARAERFYARNGFVRDPVEYSCGPLWFHRPLFRMVRR